MNNCTKEELIQFEEWCVDQYHKGNIRSPLHLSGSLRGEQEDALIEIFKEINPNDWIFCTYRSHYHALLKGVSQEWLKKWILENKSIHLMNKDYKIVTSAIVGGQLSQAVGCAMAIKRKSWSLKGDDAAISQSSEVKTVQGGYLVNPPIPPHVWVFCGDACAEIGIFYEMTKFAARNNLPITFVVQDDGLSTNTPTQESWGLSKCKTDIRRFSFKRSMPHYGSPRGRVNFDEVESKT